MPTQQDNQYASFVDIHMETAKGMPTDMGDVSMGTARAPWNDDIQMETARAGTTMKQGGLQMWERELLESSEIKRKATVAQLCTSIWAIACGEVMTSIACSHFSLDFLDYYFQTLGYLASRKDRRQKFDADTTSRGLSPNSSEYTKEFKSYCGRERVLLRRRRTKLRVDQFHIIAQVGQGGYGEVFLARKQETGEVCALKKMKKRTLFKMDEVNPLSSEFRKIIN
jgi:cell cycle protein kinase DBF2